MTAMVTSAVAPADTVMVNAGVAPAAPGAGAGAGVAASGGGGAVAAWFCAFCGGRLVAASANFCAYCGQRVSPSASWWYFFVCVGRACSPARERDCGGQKMWKSF